VYGADIFLVPLHCSVAYRNYFAQGVPPIQGGGGAGVNKSLEDVIVQQEVYTANNFALPLYSSIENRPTLH